MCLLSKVPPFSLSFQPAHTAAQSKTAQSFATT